MPPVAVTLKSIAFVLAATGTAAAVEPREYRLENGGSVAPLMTIEIGSDSNPLRSKLGSGASPFLRLKPEVTFNVRRRNNGVAFTYNGDYLQYAETYCQLTPNGINVLEDGDCVGVVNEFDKASYQNHEFGANADFEVNRRLRVAADLEFGIRNQPLGTGLTASPAILSRVTSPDSYRFSNLRLSMSYGATRARGEVRAGLSLSSLNFDDDVDIPSRGIGNISEQKVAPDAALFFRVGSRTKVFGGLGVDSVRGRGARTSSRVFAGLEFDSSDVTSGSVEFSNVNQNFDDESPERRRYTGWDVALNWKPRRYSVVTISGGRQSARAVVSEDDVGIATKLGLSWRHAWSTLLVSKVTLNLTDNDQTTILASSQEDESDGNDTITAIRVQGTYAFKRWLDVGVFFETDRRNSSISSEREYERSVVGVTVSGTI